MDELACLVSTLDLAVVGFGTVDLASLGHLIEAVTKILRREQRHRGMGGGPDTELLGAAAD